MSPRTAYKWPVIEGHVNQVVWGLDEEDLSTTTPAEIRLEVELRLGLEPGT